MEFSIFFFMESFTIGTSNVLFIIITILGADTIQNDGIYTRYFTKYTGNCYMNVSS